MNLGYGFEFNLLEFKLKEMFFALKFFGVNDHYLLGFSQEDRFKTLHFLFFVNIEWM